jgi:hypothetical protein
MLRRELLEIGTSLGKPSSGIFAGIVGVELRSRFDLDDYANNDRLIGYYDRVRDSKAKENITEV